MFECDWVHLLRHLQYTYIIFPDCNKHFNIFLTFLSSICTKICICNLRCSLNWSICIWHYYPTLNVITWMISYAYMLMLHARDVYIIISFWINSKLQEIRAKIDKFITTRFYKRIKYNKALLKCISFTFCFVYR